MVMRSLSPLSASDLQLFLANPEQLLQQSMELQLAVASFIDTPRNLLEVLVNSPLGRTVPKRENCTRSELV